MNELGEKLELAGETGSAISKASRGVLLGRRA
jgi:hypothetical protein